MIFPFQNCVNADPPKRAQPMQCFFPQSGEKRRLNGSTGEHFRPPGDVMSGADFSTHGVAVLLRGWRDRCRDCGDSESRQNAEPTAGLYRRARRLPTPADGWSEHADGKQPELVIGPAASGCTAQSTDEKVDYAAIPNLYVCRNQPKILWGF